MHVTTGLTLIVVGTLLLLAIVLPPILTTELRGNSTPLPPRLAFEDNSALEHEWQIHACGCNNSWTFGNDERNISNAKFTQETLVVDPRGLSSMAAFFGQVIDHDIVLSGSNASDGTFQIPMTPQDEVILSLTRSTHRLGDNGCREAANRITPVLDGSFVYGDEALLPQLRNGTTCYMQTSDGNLLPLSTTHPREFLAGDERNTEHSVLASMHTLFVREHNRLCTVLEAEQPSWSGDELFWKVRQIVVAKFQHIAYSEWIPAIFGSQAHLLQDVPLTTSGLRMKMEFSVLAFRFGHSMIPDTIGNFTLPVLFFNRTLLIEHGVEPFLSGAYSMPANRVDNQVIDGLRNFLFAAGPVTMGEDLVARNLFRARELGMGTYAQIAYCYGVDTQNDETEAFIGLLSEPLVEGSSLPRTIAHIVAEQFKRMRLYDPRFYDTPQNRALIGGRFLPEVYSTTLASIIRANTELTNVPDNVFFV